VVSVGDRRDLVVAGQSFGGFTAALVAQRLPVDALVFVAGMIPRPGETPDDWLVNTAMREPWPLRALPAIPTGFVLCTQDRFFPAEFMRRQVAERLGITPDDIEAGHCVALSRPKDLADILQRHARH
jgi:pimeloyl-ACP methyl ester carboxylesterase